MICVALYALGMAALGLVVRRYNAPLLNARANWRHKDTRRFDKILLSFYMPLGFVLPVVAGLDVVQFRWSAMPGEFACVGGLLFLLGVALAAWAMAVNPFAEMTVRIQTDRGHRVVRSGLYRAVRHPLYVGGMLMYLALSLILGSVWSPAPAALLAGILVLRTALEDATLRRELPRLCGIRPEDPLPAAAGNLVERAWSQALHEFDTEDGLISQSPRQFAQIAPFQRGQRFPPRTGGHLHAQDALGKAQGLGPGGDYPSANQRPGAERSFLRRRPAQQLLNNPGQFAGSMLHGFQGLKVSEFQSFEVSRFPDMDNIFQNATKPEILQL
jgi:protein-S-isoprenylcysteine O-methyltransferase Ste14